MQAKPIAIIGMGAIFPKALNLKDFWRLILNGRDAVTKVPETHWSPADYYNADRELADHLYCKRGGFLEPLDFDPAEFGIPPANLEATDTTQLLSLVAARMALDSAGYGKNSEFNRARASVIMGVTGTQELVIPLSSRLSHPRWRKAMKLAGIDEYSAAEVMDLLSESYVKWQENSFPGLLGNVVAGRISNRLDLRGTNCVVDAACASSLGALHLALLELEAQKSDMVVTGGADTLNDVFMHMCFCKTGVLSHTGDIRPFAANADGTVLGEGIGMLVLKRLEDAERDNDNIFAVIKGMGSASDGKSQSIYAPTIKGQAQALNNAYEAAGVDPATVGLIEGHGTGTLVGDKIEISALAEVFKNAAPHQTSVGSVKALVGHTKAAAGAAGIIKAALALYNKVLPPSIKIENPNQVLNDAASPFYLNNTPRPWVGDAQHPRRAGVSAFGFGGSNFHAVLEEYWSQKQQVSWDNTTQILAFSSNELDVLQSQVEIFAGLSLTKFDDELAFAAMQTRKAFNHDHDLRLLVLLDENTDIAAILKQALEICALAMPQNTGNIFFGQGKPEGKLAFLFPGQGSQYPQMGVNYATRFPQALHALDLFNAEFKADKRLSDFIYPTAVFNEDDRKAQFTELTQTSVAQPALGAVNLGMLETLRYFGINPDCTMGHSFGELSALHAAGWLNDADFIQMAVVRGKAVEHACAHNSQGAMLAVYANAAAIEPIIAESGLDVCIANLNAANQTVLAGTAADIQQISEILRKRNLKATQLQVSGAFHSKFVAQASTFFAENTQNRTLTPTDTPVISNITGQPYPQNAGEAYKLLCEQIASPVNFMGGVESLYNMGVRTFIEVGPKNVLSALLNTNLAAKDAEILSLDKSRGRSELNDLAEVLCRLAAAGYGVDLARWEEDVAKPRAQVMKVPLCGANFGPKEPPVNNDKPPQKALPKPRPEPLPVQPPPPIATPTTPVKAPVLNKLTPTPNYEQKSNIETINMNNTNNLNIIEQSLAAISQLQDQVTRAHEKFLDTQAEANRTMQNLLCVLAGGQPVVTQPLAPVTPVTVTAPAPAYVEQPAPEAKPAPVPPVKANIPVAAPAPKAVTPQNIAPVTGPDVTADLLAVVSELTGYPQEMLALDMQIESDLGIDSIKRVEILSTLEERVPDLPSTDPEEMAALKTLGEIVTILGATAQPTEVPASAPVSAAKAPVPDNDITAELLAVVSDLTGYPREMLALDMQIESDLGIDSIKRVEILSTLEERIPNLPATDPEEMAALKTLGEIAAVLGAPQVSAVQAVENNVLTKSTDANDIIPALLSVVSELTGYPQEMLALDMQIESDLGIDSIKRVEILSTLEERMPHLPATDPEEMAALKTLGEIAAVLGCPSHPAPVNAVPAAVETTDVKEPTVPATSTGQVPQRRVITPVSLPHLPETALSLAPGSRILLAGKPSPLKETLAADFKALGAAVLSLEKKDALAQKFDKLQGLIIFADAETEDNGDDLLLSFELIKYAGPALLADGNAFLAGISHLDGMFGFSENKIVNAADAGLGGIIKTLAIEWPTVNCRLLDIDRDWADTKTAANAILAELYLSDGLETGLNAQGRVKLDLVLSDLPELQEDAFSQDDVFVITGGARGVTAQTAIALSRAFKPKLALLGRSPRPFKEPEWLQDLTDQGAIKKAIIAHDFKNAKPAPKNVEAKYKSYMANREINASLNAMCALGANAKYYSVDVLDAKALATALTDVRADMGKISVLVHGAGVLEDKLVLEKTTAQFKKVYTTKVQGLHNLLRATTGDAVKAVLLFSSVTARMGNKGQADYAAANEILNKTAQNLHKQNPEIKVTSFNWGPWDGGMVSPLLKKEFAELKVDLIDMTGGAEAFVREAAALDTPAEIVFGSGFEALLPPMAKDPAIGQASKTTPLSGLGAKVNGFTPLFDLEVTPAAYPVLKDHMIDGNYVTPFALSLEWMAHAALHDNPGLCLAGIENARVFKGLVLPADNAEAEITLCAVKPVKSENGNHVVNVEIRARQDGKSFVHAGADIILATELPTYKDGLLNAFAPNYSRSSREIYADILFHGSLLQGLSQVTHCSGKGAEAICDSLSKPRDYVRNPLRSTFLMEPLIIDSAFQLASLWCYENYKSVSLPSNFKKLELYEAFKPNGGLCITLEVKTVKGQIMQGDLTFSENDKVIAKISGFEAVMNEALNQAFKPHLKIAV